MEVFMKNKTIQRKFILNYLQKTDNHPTAKEIYFALIPKLPQISQATVYRNLKLMAAEGKIQQIFLSNNEMHFDADLTPHFHAYCPKCGKIKDINHPVLYEQILSETPHLKCQDFCLVFIVKCENCE